MAFVLSQAQSFWATIAFELESDDQVQEMSFKVKLKHLPADEVARRIKAIRRAKALEEKGEESELLELLLATVGEVLLDWTGVEDDDGKPLACTAESRDNLARFMPAALAIANAWAEHVMGAKAKNSKAPLATGRTAL
jgi:hypothetical protein